MIVNDTNRAAAAAILADLMAEAAEMYGYSVVLPAEVVDETIRVTRPGHLPRMLRYEYNAAMDDARDKMRAHAGVDGGGGSTPASA